MDDIHLFRNDGITHYQKKPNNIIFSEKCYPLCYYYNYDKVAHLEYSNKIIMPKRILEKLSQYETIVPPYMFELVSDNGTSVVSAHDFKIGINGIYIPHIILDRINMNDNISKIIGIRFIETDKFDKGEKVIIQPHKTDFLDIEDHKTYLEAYLNNYTLLKTNSTIMIPGIDDYSNIYLNIIHTEPSDIISTIDSDLEVEFKAPLNYVEPKNIVKNEVKKSNDIEYNGGGSFVEFTKNDDGNDGNDATHIKTTNSFPGEGHLLGSGEGNSTGDNESDDENRCSNFLDYYNKYIKQSP